MMTYKENEYDLEPLFKRIDELCMRQGAVIAIDGGSGSGKTTLAQAIKNRYGAYVIHMDDFYLPKEKRNQKRLDELAGHMDKERFLDTVLIPLSKNQEVTYRPFDCKSQELKDAVTVTPKALTVIEGSYSLYPDFTKYYSLTVFLDVDEKKRRERVLKRCSSEKEAQAFFDTWIPLENTYFEATDIKNRCDLIIKF